MLNIQELTQYFTSVFSILKRLHPDAPEFQQEGSVKTLASGTANNCMKAFDIDEDNKLSIDEFRAYFFPQAQAAKEAKAVEAAVASLFKIRPEKLLSNLPSEEGLDLEGFVSWIGKFTSTDKCDDESYALMFKAIDVDDSGKLDRDEIMAAVSMFCRGGSPKGVFVFSLSLSFLSLSSLSLSQTSETNINNRIQNEFVPCFSTLTRTTTRNSVRRNLWDTLRVCSVACNHLREVPLRDVRQ